MTTAHFWMGAGATLGAAAMMGLGLGSYVTSPQVPARNASEYVETVISDQAATDTSFAMQKGPGAIHCTGCGPTLAERRWQADMAELELDAMTRGGSSDPAMRDYEAEQPPEDIMPAAAPVPVRIVPPQAARFADDAPPPAIVTRTGASAVPPPTLVATTAEGVRP
ncbi:hypothetical protein [Sphingobium cupriresistens]|uniref:Uncharacterized protein n=1 Tax=Sphingobium cupriresistens LL01 TaxID=1420583 RepID=A0A0J7XQD7_9SPHN|nr:hypothetical protein [Sphingobium cupriresistens]KMS53864.1 hypothetical protein V473_16750 [Sphingobium cupriresistens LL01]